MLAPLFESVSRQELTHRRSTFGAVVEQLPCLCERCRGRNRDQEANISSGRSKVASLRRIDLSMAVTVLIAGQSRITAGSSEVCRSRVV
jgi:hypothetical protein